MFAKTCSGASTNDVIKTAEAQPKGMYRPAWTGGAGPSPRPSPRQRGEGAINPSPTWRGEGRAHVSGRVRGIRPHEREGDNPVRDPHRRGPPTAPCGVSQRLA